MYDSAVNGLDTYKVIFGKIVLYRTGKSATDAIGEAEKMMESVNLPHKAQKVFLLKDNKFIQIFGEIEC